MVESMCSIQRSQRADRTSLGVFRPKEVLDIEFEQVAPDTEKQRIAEAWAAQGSLLDDPAERTHQLEALELMPWKFKYRYLCSDPACNSHSQSIIDWEIAETFRRVRWKEDWQDRIKARWIGDLCAPGRDTAFFVGNQHQHPISFLVLGVWWPERRPEQLALPEVSDL